MVMMCLINAASNEALAILLCVQLGTVRDKDTRYAHVSWLLSMARGVPPCSISRWLGAKLLELLECSSAHGLLGLSFDECPEGMGWLAKSRVVQMPGCQQEPDDDARQPTVAVLMICWR